MDKSKKIMIIVIIILAVIILGLVGTLVFVLLNNNANSNNENTDTITNETTNTVTNETVNNKATNKSTNNTTANKTANNTTTNKTANNTTNNTTTNTATKKDDTKKEIPYVEKNGIKVLTTAEEYSNPVYYYTTNTEETRDLVDVGAKFENNLATFKFYDYTVSKPDKNGNVEISFKYDEVIPIQYTREDYSYKEAYYYNTMASEPEIFDYYTGEIYLYNEYNESDSADSKEMKFNEIKWNGKTIKVGLYTENTYKWNGKETVKENVFKDEYRETTTYHLSVPKDYTGVMVALNKNGTTKQAFENTRNYRKKLSDLRKQAETDGKKSKELIEMEAKENTMTKLLESKVNSTPYKKDDFYVFKASTIKPKK